ncbi:acetyltransferase [Vogesella sp. GCM10023246]|uniref:Acetyltransferase n=1 Tax=Vogesella oryzagri TaxID=3160864 RepID=A0ABV1MAJ1_9NEIS
MSKLFIVGAGEFAQIAYEYFTHDSEHEVVGFCVNREYIKETTLFGLPVTALEEVEQKYPASEFLAFIGIPASDMNRLRMRLYLEMKQLGFRFASYVSSRAFTWHNAVIGENTFIFENNVIQPFTRIGNNCILWSGNHIGHRTVIHDHCFLTSHVVVSGYCDIGSGSFLGVNSTLNDNIKIGTHCLVGSGSLIVKDTEAERIYVGNPARAVPGKSSFEAGI